MLRHLLFCLLLILGLPYWNQAQPVELPAQCLAVNKVRVATTFDLTYVTAGQPSREKKMEAEYYDLHGNQLVWRQYEMSMSDTSTAGTRRFTYDEHNRWIKMVDGDAPDGLVDSLQLDANGFATYRKAFRRSGEVLFEQHTVFKTDLNERRQPSRVQAFSPAGVLQSSETYRYDAAGHLLGKETQQGESVVYQQRYWYFPNGKLAYEATIRNQADTLATKRYNPAGQLLVETHFSSERQRVIDYKVVRKFDAQNREIETLTYDMETDHPTLSRREVTSYGTSCLRTGTKIYTVDILTGKEQLGAVFRYAYTFY